MCFTYLFLQKQEFGRFKTSGSFNKKVESFLRNAQVNYLYVMKHSFIHLFTHSSVHWYLPLLLAHPECGEYRDGSDLVPVPRETEDTFTTVTAAMAFYSSLVAQSLKRLPPMQETRVRSLGRREIPWRRKWQSTPVFLPGESHGRRSLVGYSPRGRKESDTTERLHLTSPHGILWWVGTESCRDYHPREGAFEMF